MSRFTAGFFLLALTAVGGYFLTLPYWQTIGALRTDIQQLQTLHTQILDLIKQRDQLTRVYNAIPEPDLVKLHAVAPQEVETFQSLVDFETIARRNGVVLSSVDFGSLAPSTGLELRPNRLAHTILVSMTLRGTYDGLQLFLKDLERTVRLFDVNELHFAGGLSALTIGLKGHMYYR